MTRRRRTKLFAAASGCALACACGALPASARMPVPGALPALDHAPVAVRSGSSVRGFAAASGFRPAAPALGSTASGLPATCDAAFATALAEARVAWSAGDEGSAGLQPGGNAEAPPRRSAVKAALMSALVPGLGQLMSGHPKMGVAYLGVEAAGWTGYSILRTDGFDKRREARHFADAHYDSTVYNRRKDESAADLPNKELPYNDDLEYYEDISKLNEVIWGWDDHVPRVDGATQQLLPGTSDLRESYKGMRNDGNEELRTSRNIGMVLFVNHIASAIHAFKLVQWYNQNVNREFSGLRLKVKQTSDKQGFCCIVSKRF